MSSKLEFRLGIKNPRDYGFISSILNNTWESLINATPEIIEKRFGSGALFVVGYIEDRPVGILETIAIKTKGIFDNIPKTYYSLTNKGLWIPPSENADTVMLVDITSDKNARCSGVGSGIVDFGLNEIAAKTPYLWTWTYTPYHKNIAPDKETAVEWHKKRGALPTGYIIEGAREGFILPNVMVMNYTLKMLSFRAL